jgi:hypothetical protein
MMRPHSLLGRLSLPVAMIAMTALGAAAPANAGSEVELPEVELLVPDRVVTVDGPAKSVKFEVANIGGVVAEDVVVSYRGDALTIDPSIGFTPPAGCTDRACTIGKLAPGARRSFTFTVRPTAELPDTGATFHLSLTRRGIGGDLRSPITVVRAEKGVDIEVGAIKDIKLAPGGSATIPVAVRNAGNQTAYGISVWFDEVAHLDFPIDWTNCRPFPDPYRGVICHFDQIMEPGDVLVASPSTPLRVKAAADAPGPARYHANVYARALEPNEELPATGVREDAPDPKSPLRLVPMRQGRAYFEELNGWDNSTSFVVAVSKNPADAVALGADFTGAIGAVRTIRVGVRNDGPASTPGPEQERPLTAKVTIPSGLGLKKVDDNCVPLADGEPVWDQPGRVSGHYYLCVVPKSLHKGDKALFSFTAEIQNGENEDEGSITVDGGAQDPKTGNNVAKIAVQVAGSAGSGGGLPVTGAPAALLGGGGALLLIAGAVAFILARRRRIVTVAE